MNKQKLTELYKARGELVQKFKDEKEFLRMDFKAKLNAIDKQIEGAEGRHVDKQGAGTKEQIPYSRAAKVRSVMKDIR